MRNKKLLILACFLIVCAVLVRVMFRMDGKQEPGCVKNGKTASEKMTLGMTWFFTSLFDRFHEPNTIRIEKTGFIKDVVLEKETACVDEDVEVYVEASNPAGADSNLYYQIGTEPGNPGIVRFSEQGAQTFNVIVKDFTGANIDTREVSLKIVECGERPVLSFSFGYSGANQEIIEFEITDREGLSGNCAYAWDFGDGKTLSTNRAFVSHDYRARKQDRYISSFSVQVVARDAKGKTARARQTVTIPNVHYVSNQMGHPSVPVRYDRFPEIKGNAYSVKVTMTNIYDEEIQFTNAKVKFNSCTPGSVATEEEAGISSLLKRSVIPPQGSIDETISIEDSLIPEDTCVVGIEFTGTLGSGKNVKASVYLDIPPRGDNVPANAEKVMDDAMIEKLNRAEKILGKGKPITPDDLEQLEREGML
ncbi:MAG TPA: PKD domain-containing protein [Spirochaetota bacterium]|nr:PKD domain-containing protein [Spirochaetota bacterium]